MTAVVHNVVDWRRERDKDGHRIYKVKYLVEAEFVNEGPQTVSQATGLPVTGDSWAEGIDSDAFALCWPTEKITPVVTAETNKWWIVEKTFTTQGLDRCQDTDVEDPLSEPDKLSGSFVKFSKEATVDKDGDPILNSAKEVVRGPTVERDFNNHSVKIEKNISTLILTTFTEMIDTLNDATLWGLAARKVKLSNVSWQRKLFGVCTFYYTVTYEFDIDFTTWDRTIIDEGTKELGPGGNNADPRDFIKAQDKSNKDTTFLLDGAGAKWDGTGSPGQQTVQFYDESNFLLLDIPTSL